MFAHHTEYRSTPSVVDLVTAPSLPLTCVEIKFTARTPDTLVDFHTGLHALRIGGAGAAIARFGSLQEADTFDTAVRPRMQIRFPATRLELRPPGINKARLLQQVFRLVLLLLHLLVLP